MKKLRFSIKLATAMIGITWSFCAFAELAIISNLQNPLESLPLENVTNIFLGKTTLFPDGTKVIPIDQTSSSPAYNEFRERILQMSNVQLKSYWSRMIFTGKGFPPPYQEENDSGVIKLVSSNPSMLGYINSNDVNSSVKVLLLIK